MCHFSAWESLSEPCIEAGEGLCYQRWNFVYGEKGTPEPVWESDVSDSSQVIDETAYLLTKLILTWPHISTSECVFILPLAPPPLS